MPDRLYWLLTAGLCCAIVGNVAAVTLIPAMAAANVTAILVCVMALLVLRARRRGWLD